MRTDILRRILEYLLVICIILEFNTPYLIFPMVKQVIQIFPVLILFVLLIISKYSIIKKQNLLILIYWAGAFFPMLVLKEDNYKAYILRYALILPLLWMYLMQRKAAGDKAYCSLFIRYSNVMIIIAVLSLVMWGLCSMLKIIPATALFPYEWSPNKNYIPTYWGIYFETQAIAPFGDIIWRNTGIFNEGPMFNMALCTAFIIEYFIRSSKSKPRLWILAVTIFTTFTTTGQLFLIGMIIWSMIDKIGRKYQILLLFIFPLFLYIGYIAAEILLVNKMETGGESSMEARTDDIEWCLEAGMEHPILGVGLILREGESLWNGMTLGRSNSLFTVFARGGLYTMTLYIGSLLLIPYLYYRKYKNPKWFYTMACFFLIFTITISFSKYLTFLFMAWGLSNIDLKRWKTIEESPSQQHKQSTTAKW